MEKEIEEQNAETLKVYHPQVIHIFSPFFGILSLEQPTHSLTHSLARSLLQVYQSFLGPSFQ